MKCRCNKDIRENNTIYAMKGDIVEMFVGDSFKNLSRHSTCRDWNLIWKNIFTGGFTALSSEETTMKEEKVNHPSHYTWLREKCGIEVIDITRWLDFDTGNAVKYLLRAGYKSEEGMTAKEKTIEDLKKAIWYINDKIEILKNGN